MALRVAGFGKVASGLLLANLRAMRVVCKAEVGRSYILPTLAFVPRFTRNAETRLGVTPAA